MRGLTFSLKIIWTSSFFLAAINPSQHLIAIQPSILCAKSNEKVIDVEYEKAKRAVSKILVLSKTLGISKQGLMKIALFIEKDLPKYVEKGEIYVKKEKSGLPRTIEYDPSTGRTFIHLKRHNISELGRGKYKKATLSILYHTETPELIANCVAEEAPTIRKEYQFYKELGLHHGLVEVRALTKHIKAKTGKKVYSFLLKYYPSNLRSAQHNKMRFSNDEKVQIMYDWVSGVTALHEMNITHNDLHNGNLALGRFKDPSRGTIARGAIIDFSRISSESSRSNRPDYPQAIYYKNPPEVYSQSLKSLDYKAIDVYALGLALWYLFYDERPSWTSAKSFKKSADYLNRSIPKRVKQRIKQSALNDTSRNLSKSQRCEKLIMQMVDINPQKRGTMQQHLAQMQRICNDN